MLFLIEYDRQRGKIITMTSFEDLDRLFAEESRLELELDRNKKAIDNEVVLLEASSEKAVRRTHRRYFEDLTELATSPN